jgi:hypothetical protein
MAMFGVHGYPIASGSGSVEAMGFDYTGYADNEDNRLQTYLQPLSMKKSSLLLTLR